MIINTVTTSYANNYGALLQTYALSRYLNELPDVKCEVLQYYRSGYRNSWNLIRKPKTFRDVVKNLYRLFYIPIIVAHVRKNRIMSQFQKEYIPFTKKAYFSQRELYENPPEADVFICGSDQIWNMKYWFEDKLVYFLDFVPNDKKCISYAASIADPWKEEHIQLLEPIIQKFKSISIREYGNLEYIRRIYPNAEVVIDPVFLLSRSDWTSFATYGLCPDEPYIFCYFLSVTPLAVKTVEKLRSMYGYKVVHLNLNALDQFHSDYNIRVASPTDFVGLIAKAAVVCTNSFHCSAFSTIFHRNFCFVPKNMANERIVNLQEKFSLGNRMISNERLDKFSRKDIEIDYSVGEQMGGAFIEASKSFLKKALYE